MQLYLPDDLYELVKSRGLPASELLQKAVRAELRRLELLDENARYLAELEAEMGQPTAAERARAKASVERITKRARRKAG
jgi:post-segregation antitoxin (ccd killing protein)